MSRFAQIRYFPDPILRKSARPVKTFDQKLQKIVDVLDQTMRREKHGIGIAAPQIGLSLRLAIVDVSDRVKGTQRLVLCNPEIVRLWDERASREGCMSVPDYTANIKRYDGVEVEWQNEKGESMSLATCGIEAVCIQHEVDHLDGRLFIDRVISLKKDMIPRPKRS